MDKQWRAVPAEPTPEMLDAAAVAVVSFDIDSGSDMVAAAYSAMIENAPQPPSTADEHDLPPMPPQMVITTHTDTGLRIYGHSADQMRAYAVAAIARSPGVDAWQRQALTLVGYLSGINSRQRDAAKVDLVRLIENPPTIAPSPATSAEHEPATRIRFPAHLRKMWSGSEVQAWLDDLVGAAPIRPTARGSLARCRAWQAEQGTPTSSATGEAAPGNEEAPQ